MNFPDLEYIRWAKAMPEAAVNLARSGVEPCPPSLLGPAAKRAIVTLPVRYGWPPLLEAIGARYRVPPASVYAVSGGTSYANWLACAAALDGAPANAEVIVERPTYEPLLGIVEALGARVRRLDRRFEDEYAIDLDRFGRLVNGRTRLAIVTNLHNPSGARIDTATLAKMAQRLDRVGALLLVDEVYLECQFGTRPTSCVHAGPNVVTTNSLTKAYGLDGMRAGWILGPPAFARHAALVNNLMANNNVATGEWLTRVAFSRLAPLRRRAQAILAPNLARVRRFFREERRFAVVPPVGGNVAFPRLPAGIDGDAFADLLLDRYSTIVVPGRFFETPQHVRISFGVAAPVLERGLRNLSAALDDFKESSGRTPSGHESTKATKSRKPNRH